MCFFLVSLSLLGWFNLVSSLVYAVFLCGHTTGCEAYFCTTDGYGILNLRTNVGACRTHDGGSGLNKSAEELTRGGGVGKTLTLPRQGIEPRVFG